MLEEEILMYFHAKLSNTSMIVHLLFSKFKPRSVTSKMLIVILSMTLLLSMVPFAAQASGNSYKIWVFGADPELNNGPFLPTYDKLTPASLPSPGTAGRYADPPPNAVCYATPSKYDGVNSLDSKDIALGQIVPFEVQIAVNGDTAPENGEINFTMDFNSYTTGNDEFGFDPTYMVYAAFVDSADPGTIDPGNNSKVDSYSSELIGSGIYKRIKGTFNVSGLDNGDRVIVEIWVVLMSTIPPSSSGDIQAVFMSSQTANGDVITKSSQTIPLQRVRKYFTDSADVSVVKNDSPDPVIQGQRLNFSLVVTNNDPATIANGIIVIDTLFSNTTFISCNDSSYTISENNITFNVGSLSPGQSKIITLVVVSTDLLPEVI